MWYQIQIILSWGDSLKPGEELLKYYLVCALNKINSHANPTSSIHRNLVVSIILQNKWTQILKYHLAKIFNVLKKHLKPLMNTLFSQMGVTKHWLLPHLSFLSNFKRKKNFFFPKTTIISHKKWFFFLVLPASLWYLATFLQVFRKLHGLKGKNKVPFWKVIRQSIQFILNTFSFPLVSLKVSKSTLINLSKQGGWCSFLWKQKLCNLFFWHYKPGPYLPAPLPTKSQQNFLFK